MSPQNSMQKQPESSPSFSELLTKRERDTGHEFWRSQSFYTVKRWCMSKKYKGQRTA